MQRESTAKASVTVLAEPDAPALSSAEIAQHLEQVRRDIEEAQKQFNRCAFACSTDRNNPEKRAAFDDAQRALACVKAEADALTGAKFHALKREGLESLEQQLVGLESMRRESIASVDAAGQAFESIFAAVRQVGEAWRTLTASELDAVQRVGSCFVRRGGNDYPEPSLDSFGLVQALLAFELQGRDWNLVPAAYRFGDPGPFDPAITREFQAKQRERAKSLIDRYCDLRAEALRAEIEAERAALAA